MPEQRSLHERAPYVHGRAMERAVLFEKVALLNERMMREDPRLHPACCYRDLRDVAESFDHNWRLVSQALDSLKQDNRFANIRYVVEDNPDGSRNIFDKPCDDFQALSEDTRKLPIETFRELEDT